MDNEDDVEFLGGYMEKITHYDEWDEWVHQTCTRQVPCGTDKDGHVRYRTETYDCSHRVYHPDRYTYTDEAGEEHYFCEEWEFNRALKELGNPKQVFKEMNRHYYHIDGDAQEYYWDHKPIHVRAITTKHHYKNKVNVSNSIFNFENISEKKAKELGLYNYPEVENDDQEVIMGFKVRKDVNKLYKYVNAVYGPAKQFRLFVLVFPDKPIDISEKQRSYWKGGNKNEFVVCIGYNTKTGNIEWCNPFSWCDKPALEVATKRYFREHSHMNINQYPYWLMENIDLWKRKEFKDFDYIQNEMTYGQCIFVLIIVLLLDIILGAMFIFNEFENEHIKTIPMGYYIKEGVLTLRDVTVSWWLDTLIPALNKLEEKYKNTFTWK